MDNTILITITIFLYFAISGYQYYLCYKKQDDSQAQMIALFSVLPLLCHGWLLLLYINVDSGQNMSFFNIVSLTFWIVSILIIISSIRKKLGILVMMILPITGLSLIASQFISQKYMIETITPGYLMHILISIAALSVISLAAIQSLFVNALDNRLKKHPTPMAKGIPALQDMENFLYILIWTGFVLLSLSIITAIFFMPGTTTDTSLYKPLLSVLSWLFFSIFLIGRHFRGWRGKTAVHWSISGFILLFLAYFGTGSLLELFLADLPGINN